MTEYQGNLDCRQAEPNLRIVRTVFGKWSVDILETLHPQNRESFGDLRRSLEGISPRVLSAKLKLLEASGMVERSIIPSRPPKPEYALTERGQAVTTLGLPVLRYLKEQDGRAEGSSRRRRSS